MKKKPEPGKNANPNTIPTSHRPQDQSSMDSRDNNGLSKDEAMQGKK